MRVAVAVTLLAGLLAAPAARALEWPVRDLRREVVTGPSYVADRIEVRLAPAASATARATLSPAPGLRRAAPTRLGLPALDAATSQLGAWLEPEFRGETPPPAGSPDADFTAYYIAHLPEGVDLEAALGRLRGLPEVLGAEPIAVLPVSAVPDDSLWSTSWWYEQLSDHDIDVADAWDVTTGDTSIVVGILDTGVIPYHPDLGGTTAGLAGQIWTNWAEKGGLPGVDDDDNGFVDDLWGWDFVDRPSGYNVAPFEDWQDQDNDPNDYAGHGTQVAGIVGAITNNVHGVAGTAPQVRLMPLRIGWVEIGYPLGLVDMSFVAQAVRYASRMHVDVINCSFATLDLSGLGAALDAAIRAGLTVVSAAGNNYAPSYLAEREDVIAVGATTSSDGIASFSTLGDWVDLSAPGVGIFSTFIARAPDASDSLGYRVPAYDAPVGLSGTSFSAPQVAGAVALMDGRRKALGLRPLTPRGALLRVRETADDISAFTAQTGYGTGRLNVRRAVADRPTSMAWRAGAATVGPAVPLPLAGPARRIACVTSNARLLIHDWFAGDTVALATLPGVPARQLAAADLGDGLGVGLFVGTTNGLLAGFDTTGAVRPGFPVTTGSGAALGGGPALGDLDGDGVLEIVCGASDGQLWAWRASGAVLPGFPVMTDVSGISAPVALSDLDGRPGAEIIAATADGQVFAVAGDGSVLNGWPAGVNGGPFAPVVTRCARDTVVLVASGAQVIGLRPDGSERSSWSLPGTVVRDPALGDFDGDGTDEVAVVVSGPNRLAVLDTSGSAPAGLGWPAPLGAVTLGPPVLGHVVGDGRPGVVLMETSGLVALTDSARALGILPNLGGAGTWPVLADLAGDGAMKVAAGTGTDSMLYVYDLGAGSAAATPLAWPTPRGNPARTGSHLYLSGDALPPAAVGDLSAASVGTDSVRLTWTAPGDDGVSGTAAAFEVRRTTMRSQVGRPDAGASLAGAPVPGAAGSPQGMTLPAGEPGVTCWYWVRTRDAAGNVSQCSNLCGYTQPLGPVHPASEALAVRQRPSMAPVSLDWQGAGATSIRLYDVAGRRVRTLALERAFRGTAQWDGRDESGSLVPAGVYLARLIGGSLRAQTRVVLLP